MKKRYLIVLAGICLFPTQTIAQDYSQEQYDAYYYARNLGITTMPNIYMADMNGNLIRSHMAKMMVEYAKNVLGLQADYAKPCGFIDIQHQPTEIQKFIMEACQMGLMGLRADGTPDIYFHPDRMVTRGEFGTVLSRILRGNLFDGAIPFFQEHLLALNHAGIMKDITRPYARELRGRVMLMLMRIEQGEGSSELMCDTPENIFYCDVARTMGVELCPPECVMMSSMNAGTLSVRPFFQSNYQVSETGGIYLASLRLETTEIPIKINAFTLQLGTIRPINTTMRLEHEGKRITRKMRPNTEGVISLTIFDTMIRKHSAERIHIIVNTTIGDITVPNSSDIDSSALFMLGEYPITIKQ